MLLHASTDGEVLEGYSEVYLQHAQVDQAMAIDDAGGQAQAPDKVLPVHAVALVVLGALGRILPPK
jgi:hypothetical protein